MKKNVLCVFETYYLSLTLYTEWFVTYKHTVIFKTVKLISKIIIRIVYLRMSEKLPS